MSKRGDNDGYYAKCEVGFWFDDPRIISLPAGARNLYHYCWLAAVHKRRDWLGFGWTLAYLGSMSGLSRARDWLEYGRTLVVLRLIEIDKDGVITVCGAMKKHSKIPQKLNIGGSPDLDVDLDVDVNVDEKQSSPADHTKSKEKAPKKERPKDPVWEKFSGLYQKENNCPPTPKASCFVSLAGLRKVHPDALISQRLDWYFGGSPEFIKPPHDFGGFVANFDRIREGGNGTYETATERYLKSVDLRRAEDGDIGRLGPDGVELGGAGEGHE